MVTRFCNALTSILVHAKGKHISVHERQKCVRNYSRRFLQCEEFPHADTYLYQGYVSLITEVLRVTKYRMFVCVSALVFVAHGAGEHCSLYADVAHKLTQHSLLVFTHDHGEWLPKPAKMIHRTRIDQEAQA